MRGDKDKIAFGPFVLDRTDERLLRDGAPIELRPKTFALLCYLAENPERLLKKEELLTAVWHETRVTETVLRVCIRELRHQLHEDRGVGHLIETVHGRGYRFVPAHTGGGAAPP